MLCHFKTLRLFFCQHLSLFDNDRCCHLSGGGNSQSSVRRRQSCEALSFAHGAHKVQQFFHKVRPVVSDELVSGEYDTRRF